MGPFHLCLLTGLNVMKLRGLRNHPFHSEFQTICMELEKLVICTHTWVYMYLYLCLLYFKAISHLLILNLPICACPSFLKVRLGSDLFILLDIFKNHYIPTIF